MKITPSAISGLARGSTLAISLVLTAIVGTVLGSYLVLIGQRSHISARSQSWNSTIAVLEGGIEEAFTHLKVNGTNLATDGWNSAVINGKPVFNKRRDFNTNSYCYVTISNAQAAPVIYSAGYVRAPRKQSEYIARMVRVTTVMPSSSPFTKAIFATATNGTAIQLSGSAFVDSFNSALGPYGPSNHSTNGSIATNSKQGGNNYAIKIGTGYVYGSAGTGPGGTVFVDYNKGGLTGGIASDINVASPTNSVPTGKTWSTITGTAGTFTLGDGYYRTGTGKALNIGSGSYIKVTGNATLWLERDLQVGGQLPDAGYIQIAPGASLTVYSQTKTVQIGGQGVVNENGSAANFSYYGLPNAGSFDYSGNSIFLGTINAPQSSVQLTGDSDFCGAIICKTFISSGNGNVHYDEGLQGGGGGTWTIASWREL